jgi:cell wall-associated NlpC family hydrolase
MATGNTHALKVLSIAQKFVDDKYVETGDNITIMGKWYGAQGQPWCAMFVSYCFDQAGLVKLVASQSKKGFAGCDAGLKFFAKKGQLVPVGQAQPGDIVFFQFDADAQPDHGGFVYQNTGKALVTLEGNTSGGSKGSQSNGGGAYKKKRAYSDVMAVVRPKWPV